VIKKEKKVKEEKEDIQEKDKNDIRLKSQMNHFMDKYFNKLMGDQQQVSKKVPWWSYKVKQGGANYALRTDIINDYFDFDSD
jgi:hypothetical protein